jgi:hypothetical protein
MPVLISATSLVMARLWIGKVTQANLHLAIVEMAAPKPPNAPKSDRDNYTQKSLWGEDCHWVSLIRRNSPGEATPSVLATNIKYITGG